MPENTVTPLRDAPTPLDAYRALRHLRDTILLESVAQPGGRYSILCADPFARLRGVGGRARLEVGEAEVVEGDPLSLLGDFLSLCTIGSNSTPEPFVGGAVGFLSYELGSALEDIPLASRRDLRLPDVSFGFYDWAIVWDHKEGEAWITTLTDLPPEAHVGGSEGRIRRVLEWLERPAGHDHSPAPLPRRHHEEIVEPQPQTFAVAELPGVRSTFSCQEYLQAVARVRRYILEGDIFQANLSQRFEVPCRAHPVEIYRRLQARNPAPFAALCEWDGVAIVSASPERFLMASGREVESKPIKGTAPRGESRAHDEAHQAALLASEKDRAENVMIVDLIRNDLSRVCEPGSVRVTGLCELESHPTVFHLVSTVRGILEDGCGPADLLRATFPGGSITGAPKLRAMEIIAEVEPTQRTVYTGSIGYIDFSGRMDMSIAIRTMVLQDGVAYVQAGGGIVADSEPESEYLETLDKARGLLSVLLEDLDPSEAPR